ncbi:hypothetical protein BU26DRAFT_601168 [Trematosphaeria pertusa]|uniref:Uncharacterized protein n=1 Tax=Trematosphaeria pertusa TaxID=390896 RepID=A0A6A6IQX5_9PLEO|nr:uncharacterized protein BU26DRAFT_601168 [Trematosphaeria pertusa]KAF2252955.1 hypothetical protein BU26DRAFT_601168 [Trematosphaeria pertusa]
MPYPADSGFYVFPYFKKGSICAGAVTGILALAGKCPPGTFLKLAAYTNSFSLTVSVAQWYAFRDVRKANFTRAAVEPKPAKLWENSDGWTVDDAALQMCAIGILAALRKKTFPGVTGWKRYFGIASTMSAVRFSGALWAFHTSTHPRFANSRQQVLLRDQELRSLAHDEKFTASLSPLGKWYLSHFAHDEQQPSAQQPTVQPCMATFPLPFNNTPVEGPDLKDGMRVYQQSPDVTGTVALQEHMDHLDKLSTELAIELDYVWQHLAKKEHSLYQMSATDETEDIARRELQLLNSIAQTLWLQRAWFEFYLADARKSYGQLMQRRSGHHEPWTPAQRDEYGVD